jgi:hypothetical protein
MPVSPSKFTSLLKHHRMHLKVVRIAPKSVSGTLVVWKDLAQFPADGQGHFPVAAAPGAKPLKLVPMMKAPKKAAA